LEQPKSGKKVFTKGKKQNVILSEEQLDRLISTVNDDKPLDVNKTIIEAYRHIRIAIINEGLNLDKEMYNYTNYTGYLSEQGQYNRDPGLAAAEGVENVINGIKKAYGMIKDSDTRKKLANSITKLSNFMSISAELIGSGASQRAPRSYDMVSDELPYPELDSDSELEEIAKGDYQLTKEDAKPDFLDLDGDGDKKESMKKASKEVKEDSGHDEAMNYGKDEGHDDKELYDLKHGGGSEDHIDDLEDDMHYDHIHDSKKIEESQKEKEMLIQEDIKRMKQVINPIPKI